jgi:hypothetical protein
MKEVAVSTRPSVNSAVVLAGVIIALAAVRLCHVNLLWSDEDYHLAAALQILNGKLPYRDFWYDKPPLSALYYLLISGYPGWPLRLLDTGYVLAACFFAYRLARAWWGPSEGRVAAVLLAFFLAFYLPAAVVGFAADALMILPHLAAVFYAFTGRAALAGLCSAIAFLINVKGLFVLAACAFWLPGSLVTLALGFVLPLIAFGGLALLSGAWPGYWEQVWKWGWIYAAQSSVGRPFRTGLIRSLDWMGFHAALVGGAIFSLVNSSSDRWKALSWIGLSLAGVCLGMRFVPHYFLQLLPPVVVIGSRGLVLAWRRNRTITAALASVALLVPFVRFAPRYFSLAYECVRGEPVQWRDSALDLDAQQVAAEIKRRARPGDTLFVWGYRPDIYVYTRLVTDGRFWDSQPLTGVPADRHLKETKPVYKGAAVSNRQELTRTKPTWVVDGLGPLNPRLAPEVFPELRPWLMNYRTVAQTKFCIIRRRVE